MPIYVPPVSPDEIYHSAKGSTWKKHKYIAIKNGRYIYPKADPKNSKNPLIVDEDFSSAEELEDTKKYFLRSLASNRRTIKELNEDIERRFNQSDEYYAMAKEYEKKAFGSSIMDDPNRRLAQFYKVMSMEAANNAYKTSLKREQAKKDTVMYNKLLLKTMKKIDQIKVKEIKDKEISRGASALVSNPLIAKEVKKITPRGVMNHPSYTLDEFTNYPYAYNKGTTAKKKLKTKSKLGKNGTILRKKKIEPTTSSSIKVRKKSTTK